MKLGRVIVALSALTGLLVAACSTSSKSKQSDDPDATFIGYGGASGASGASGAGGTAGSPPDHACATICDTIAGANCPTSVPRDQCLADCGSVTAECPAEVAAYASCLRATGSVSCDSFGDTVVSGCDGSSIRLSGCSACLQDTSDDPCVRCQQIQCCPQLKAAAGAADVFEFTECIAPCTTQACITSCENSFPIAGRAFNVLTQCVSASCLTQCSGT